LLAWLSAQTTDKRVNTVTPELFATYPTARDPRGEVFRAFGGTGLPRTVLVAADGTIVAVHNGALTASELQSLIDEKLAA